MQGNPILRIDPSGLKAIIPWDEYYAAILENAAYCLSGVECVPVDIITDVGSNGNDFARQAIDAVIANFEGAPVPDPQNPCDEPNVSSNSPNDVVAYTTQSNFPSRDYNRYDWLISGWVDYWKWHAASKGKTFVSTLQPNFVKSVAYNESLIGYVLNPENYGVMQLSKSDGDGVDGLTKLAWGAINIKFSPDSPQYNIGGGVRWLIHKYQSHVLKDSDRSGEVDDWVLAYSYYAGYTNMVWKARVQDVKELYTTGCDTRSDDGHRLFYVPDTICQPKSTQTP